MTDAGIIQWQKSLVGTGIDAAFSLKQTPDNGYIVAGYTTSGDGDVYWNKNDLNRIGLYCSKDVIAVAQVIMRLKGLELIREENIIYV